MADETNSQPRAKSQITSLLRFGVLIGFAAGIGIGPTLSQDMDRWILLLSVLTALFFYYRHDKASSD